MKNNSSDYIETNQLPFNEYLMFFTYVFFIIIIANILPVTTFTYFLFLAFGFTGIYILLVKFTYSIMINNSLIELLIKVPFKLSLLKIPINEIESIEEVQPDTPDYGDSRIKKNYRLYIFGNTNGIKITLLDGEVIIISGIKTKETINRVNKIKDQRNGYQ